jgi:hypothetical protein
LEIRSAKTTPRDCHCERSEAIQKAAKQVWILAEPVIGRAFARPVGSQ